MSQDNVTPLRAQDPPRGHATQGGEPTAPPRRSQHPPSGSLPQPAAPTAHDEHWRKHPSDYHADVAVDALGKVFSEPDSVKRSEHYQYASIHAMLSLRDAVLEHAAVMRDIRDGRKKTP